MGFKKFLKSKKAKFRRGVKKKSGQVMLEYAALVGFAIVALIAFNIVTHTLGNLDSPQPDGTFDHYFRSVAQCAGGVDIAE